jgi:ankyrin repeat protein
MKKLLPCLLLLTLQGLLQAGPVDELTVAAERNNGSGVLTLLLRGVDPNAADSKGRTALNIALREESDKALDSLLAYPQLDVNATNANDETPLMLAALKGRLEWVQLLVKRGARINRSGWTPLHYACSGPDNGVALWLIAQGADINARSPNGTTPLMMSARYGPADLAEDLLKAGADRLLRNEQELDAADFAMAAGRDRLLRLLRPGPR